MPFNLSGFNASGPCGCCGANFSYTFTIVGCANPAKNAAFFSGLTVAVYTSSGGTLLASGTTDSSGQVTLSWNDSAGPNTRYVTASTPWTGRNDAYGANRLLANGGSTTIQLQANASYVCCTNIDWAIPKTLYWTDSDGTWSLIWTGTQWLKQTNMNGTKSGVVFATCNPATINPLMNLYVGCGTAANTLVITRQWYARVCAGTNYYVDVASTGTGANTCSSQGSQSTAGGPPFAFSGTLTFQSCTGIGTPTLADPIGGTVAVSE